MIFLFFIFESAYMFIKFDLRPFSAVLSDLFIFVDNFLVLANKSALNRLILRHCYFWVAYLGLLVCVYVHALMRMRMRVCRWVCGVGLEFLG